MQVSGTLGCQPKGYSFNLEKLPGGQVYPLSSMVGWEAKTQSQGPPGDGCTDPGKVWTKGKRKSLGERGREMESHSRNRGVPGEPGIWEREGASVSLGRVILRSQMSPSTETVSVSMEGFRWKEAR